MAKANLIQTASHWISSMSITGGKNNDKQNYKQPAVNRCVYAY